MHRHTCTHTAEREEKTDRHVTDELHFRHSERHTHVACGVLPAVGETGACTGEAGGLLHGSEGNDGISCAANA
jgi:hypothetical protein